MTVIPDELGVSRQRIDDSGFITSDGATVGAYGFYAKRGSLKPKLFKTTADFYDEYGRPDASVTFAHYCVAPSLNQGDPVFGLRITDDATYGGCAVTLGTNTISSLPYPSGGSPFAADARDYSAGTGPTSPNFVSLKFSAALVTLNSTTMTIITDSSSVVVGPVVFATDSDTTMNAIVTAINVALASIGSGGVATAGETTAIRTINIFAPFDQQVAISGAAVTLGASQPTITQGTALYYLQAENPGAWSAELGHYASNPDMGQREVITLTLPAAIAATNACKVSVNGVETAVITYATSSDATLQSLATAIGGLADVLSATVTKVPLGASNDREIVITMLRGSSTAATVVATPTSGFPTFIIRQRVPGVAPDGSFDLTIFNRRNPTVAVDSFRVNLTARVDGNGVQQHIEEVINKSAKQGRYIRVVAVAPSDGSVNIPFDPVTGVIQTSIQYLSAGLDGNIPSAVLMGNAMQVFADTTKYQVNMLVNAGYTSVVYQQALKNIALLRADGTIPILDMPPEAQDPSRAVGYRTGTLAIDNAASALYAPDVEATDPYTNRTLWVPCSGHIAAGYGYNDKVRGIGKAPAGRKVGAVDTTRLRYEYSKTEQASLFKAQINPIVKRPSGFYIYGDTTMQVMQSALSFVSIFRLLGFLENKIADSLDFRIFDPLDDGQALSLTEEINRFLDPYVTGGDLKRFEVKSTADVGNTNALEDQGARIVRVYLDPKRSTRRILLQSVITRAGATFSTTELAS